MKSTQEAMRKACLNGSTERIQQLLDAGADVSAVDGMGFTALKYACVNGHEFTAELLISRDAAVDQTSPAGVTALMETCTMGRESCARVLLESGALVDHTNRNGQTALMFACANGQEPCVRLLCEWGASKTVADSDGRVAAEFARSRKHTSVAAWLEASFLRGLSRNASLRGGSAFADPGQSPGAGSSPANGSRNGSLRGGRAFASCSPSSCSTAEVTTVPPLQDSAPSSRNSSLRGGGGVARMCGSNDASTPGLRYSSLQGGVQGGVQDGVQGGVQGGVAFTHCESPSAALPAAPLFETSPHPTAAPISRNPSVASLSHMWDWAMGRASPVSSSCAPSQSASAHASRAPSHGASAHGGELFLIAERQAAAAHASPLEVQDGSPPSHPAPSTAPDVKVGATTTASFSCASAEASAPADSEKEAVAHELQELFQRFEALAPRLDKQQILTAHKFVNDIAYAHSRDSSLLDEPRFAQAHAPEGLASGSEAAPPDDEQV